jgi:hypothetical protein
VFANAELDVAGPLEGELVVARLNEDELPDELDEEG